MAQLTKHFSVQDAIKKGFNLTKANFILVFSVLLIFLAVSVLNNLFSASFRDVPVVELVVFLVFFFLQALMEIGFVKIALNLVDGKKAELKELYSHSNLLLNFILSSIAYGVLVLLGLILLVIPGIYLALRYQFFGYFIVDKGQGPLDALKGSAAMTKGRVVNILLLDLAVIGINILGALALLVGLLITIPTSFLALTYVYRKLSSS